MNNSRILAGALAFGLLSFAVFADSAAERYAKYLSQGMKTPETSKFFQRHEDPQSHVVSWIVKPGLLGHNQQSFYFTSKSMTDDGRFLMFHTIADELNRKVSHRKQLMLVDFTTDTAVALEDTPSGCLPFVDVETDEIWYVKDDAVYYRNLLKDPKAAKKLVDIPAELLPTMSERRHHYWVGHLTLTPDRKKAFFDEDISLTGDYYADSRSRQILLDLTDGTYEIWGTQDFWVNHGQLNPVNPRLAMCAYEGCTRKWVKDGALGRKQVPRPADDIYPRIFLCEPGRLTMVECRNANYATHEHWAEDGKGFYWCASGVHYHDLATGKQTMVCPLGCAHATMTRDLKYVTGDESWGGWWRGCGWTTLFWNRDAHRGIYIHSKRPVYAPKDKPSNIHPDPHPQFVCGDRYVLCSMNVKDHQLTTSITPVSELVRMTTTDASKLEPKRIPLEWNVNRDVSLPYEVTVDTQRLKGLIAKPDCATWSAYTCFAVEATLTDGRVVDVPCEPLPGPSNYDLREITLRFTPPKAAAALTLVADASPRRFELRDTATCDNLFAGAVDAAHAARWQCPKEGRVTRHRNGILLELTKRDGSSRDFTYTVDVPPEAAGKPVRLELDVRSLSKMTWPNPIVIRQLDAAGKELPEAVVDPRWTSHMRPPEKTCYFREEGRIHPRAKKLRLVVTGRYLTSPYDNHGLELKNPEDLQPRLLVTRLNLRVASLLPFPRYDDASFPAGVSGEKGDHALKVGGENIFWYQTRSQASWAEARPIVNAEDVFYPMGDGTAEAWFNAAWPANSPHPHHLFSAVHSNAHTENSAYLESRGQIMQAYYCPSNTLLVLKFIDANGKRFNASKPFALPAKCWMHAAVTWKVGGEGSLWIDGKKALSVSLKDFAPFKLGKDLKYPNDVGPVEFYCGGTHCSGRVSCNLNPEYPAVPGAIDLLRVSSAVRYTAEFTPARRFALDAATRALFTFDRTFDGVSAGGWGFVPGCYRKLDDIREHTVDVGGKRARYYPEGLTDRVNPKKALHDMKYTALPTAADFSLGRETKQQVQTMTSGDVMMLDAPKGVITDYIEYENVGQKVVCYPMLIGKGEVDPRSFGDIADTIGTGKAKDFEKCNRLFDLVLFASDYSQNHLATFHAGSDVPTSVEYEALMMLNAYCGFECGPLNNLAANVFACSGFCPSAQTAGIGHSFEEVFFDRKNRIYDLSARKFFPAMDNESVADLGDVDAEPYVIGRMGGRIGGFVRNGTRGHYVQSPAYQEKVGMLLAPGERFRLWRVHDGFMNDLQLNSCWPGNRRLTKRPTCFFKSDVEKEARAKCRSGLKKGRPGPKGNFDEDLARLDRFFPESAAGFLVFDGRPAADNPAFAATADDFTYRVKSGYPVVHGVYRAELEKGGTAALELSTDRGQTWFALPMTDGEAVVDYPVRARLEYLIRVKAPIAAVKRFAAETVVQANRRLLPGLIKPGANELALRSVGEGVAKVTVQYRAPAKTMTVKGGVFTGTIPGSERELVLVAPGQPLVLETAGLSAAAQAVAHDGVKATLAEGRLTIAADASAKGAYRSAALEPIVEGRPYLTAVDLVDGAASRQLTVLVAANARLVPATAAKLSGGAKMLAADGGRANHSAMLADKGQTARFEFEKLPAGKYFVMNLTRYQSVLDPLGGHYGAGENRDIKLNLPGFKSPVGAGAQESLPDAYWWTTIGTGKPGARANFKWEYACDPHSYYPYQMPGVWSVPEFAWAEISTPEKFPGGVEVAAVLIVPDPSRDFLRDLRKVLSGYNCEPWTCRAR